MHRAARRILSCQASAPVGHRQSAVARIARLVDTKSQLERCFVHIDVSNEYANGNERSLVWREVDTMFENGEVVNVDYIEPRRFLEDA